MLRLYGIKNCDTIKKTRKWLDQHNVNYTFHDLRNDGLDASTLQLWIASVGWEALVNRRSTTWRNLPDAKKANIDAATAQQLMLDQVTLIKRPVISNASSVVVGYSEEQFKQLL